MASRGSPQKCRTTPPKVSAAASCPSKYQDFGAPQARVFEFDDVEEEDDDTQLQVPLCNVPSRRGPDPSWTRKIAF